ncbi:MAG: CopG family transcriptional regulator [Alphaproteobacteria bacterium]|nr:CopG family transcriptional regulator [Alphaproteobacteria bacterium]
MTTISLRLPDNIVHRIDVNAHLLHVTRSEYIKKAIIEMNADVQEQTRKQRLMAASQLVRKESMKINAEFAAIEDDPEA